MKSGVTLHVHHAALTVRNLEKSLEYYIGKLGFEIVSRFDRPDLDGQAALTRLQGFHLELWQFGSLQETSVELDYLQTPGIRHLAFAVSDLHSTLRHLKNQGLDCTAPVLGASGHLYSFTKDPDGIPLELYQL